LGESASLLRRRVAQSMRERERERERETQKDGKINHNKSLIIIVIDCRNIFLHKN